MLECKTLADSELLRNSSIKGTPEYRAVETVLKGGELPMPTGHQFFDHQGNKRTEFRARWWDKEEPLPTAKNMIFPPKEDFPDTPLLPEDVVALPGYDIVEKPVFIGHYYKPADSLLDMEASCNGKLYADLTIDHEDWMSDSGFTMTYYIPVLYSELVEFKKLEPRRMTIHLMEISVGRANICHDAGVYSWQDEAFHPYA